MRAAAPIPPPMHMLTMPYSTSRRFISWNRVVMMRAPVPILLCAGTHDFFDICGSWWTFRFAKRLYVRLGFAVAAHVEADVLLVDEVLAVGDAEFRQKCLSRMEELRKSGTTLIFVSHNMYQVRRLCRQALLLVRGEPRCLGEVGEAIAAYERIIQGSHTNGNRLEIAGKADGPGTFAISNVTLLDSAAQPVSRLSYNQPLTVSIGYQARKPVVDPVIRLRLVRSDNTVCAMTASAYYPDLTWTLSGQGTITVQLEPVQLAAGRYLVDLRVLDSTDTMLLSGTQSDWFDVYDHTFGHETQRGVFVPTVNWAHEPDIENR